MAEEEEAPAFEVAPDGAKIWRGSRSMAAVSILVVLLVLFFLWFLWRLFFGQYESADTPDWYKAITLTFGTCIIAGLAGGAVYGVVSAIATFVDRRPVLRIDDTGVQLRNYMQLRDWSEPRTARWSEIERVSFEEDPRTARRVHFNVYLSLTRDGKVQVWTINAPAISEYAKTLFDALEREWMAHRGRRREDSTS